MLNLSQLVLSLHQSLPGVGEDIAIKCPDVKTQSSLISEVIAPPEPVIDVFKPFIHKD